jgi:uncharacterized metal-binding protein
VTAETRRTLLDHSMRIIENVACSDVELLRAINAGSLRPGYGFEMREREDPPAPGVNKHEAVGERDARVPAPPDPSEVDCLACEDRVCLRGGNCLPGLIDPRHRASRRVHRMLEAAADVSSEEERKLCRLTELIYFCLEMDYRRIGIAFCLDLTEPARILAGVLRRFFEPVPVCCKVGGITQRDPVMHMPARGELPSWPAVACNPIAQARVLNKAGTDLNVIVGLCMGADCVFTQRSRAPVSTLFVKDKSLANNPIGAVYSEYYLRESASPSSAVLKARPHRHRRHEPVLTAGREGKEEP